MNSAERIRNKILFDEAASFWLKDVLRTSWTRDPVDALRDAKVLSGVLQMRLNEALSDLAADK